MFRARARLRPIRAGGAHPHPRPGSEPGARGPATMQQPEAERRVLLVIDTSTRRIVSTRPLQASTNADLLLAEYMSYQQAVQAEVARGQPPPPADPFVLRTHGETNEAGGRFMYVELADAPGRVPPPPAPATAAVDTDDKGASASRGRRRSSSSRRSGSPSPQGSPTRGSGSSRCVNAARACAPSQPHPPPFHLLLPLFPHADRPPSLKSPRTHAHAHAPHPCVRLFHS